MRPIYISWPDKDGPLREALKGPFSARMDPTSRQKNAYIDVYDGAGRPVAWARLEKRDDQFPLTMTAKECKHYLQVLADLANARFS